MLTTGITTFHFHGKTLGTPQERHVLTTGITTSLNLHLLKRKVRQERHVLTTGITIPQKSF